MPYAYYFAAATKYPEQKRWVFPPAPPTPEMVARAQPYRADTLQELEASIKNTRTAIVIDG